MVVNDAQIERRREPEIFKPLEHYKVYRNAIVAGDCEPAAISIRQQGLDRLQKLMDEYCGGVTVSYMTNEKLLISDEKTENHGRDLECVAAKDLHELLRAWNSNTATVQRNA